ncbi:MAG: DUF4330 domain-containing protein [Cyanobacteriota bacterium]|jgi:hypothetical protein|nr:DUF4330 domain-containing protein [Cyanobacteriota bacterium]
MVSKPGSPESKPRWGVLDIGAAAAVLLAAVGVVWSPKLGNAVASATGKLAPVTVMVDIRGMPAADPAALIAAVRSEGSVAIVIRNQPHGSVRVKAVKPLQRRLVALQPDGRVVTALDPNQQIFSTLDARFELVGQGRKTGGGVVFGNQNLKIGAPVELEGKNFRVSGTVTGLEIGA